jgi:hypothetical protein
MEEKKGRTWTEEQKQGARERALFYAHRDTLKRVATNPAMLNYLKVPQNFKRLEELAGCWMLLNQMVYFLATASQHEKEGLFLFMCGLRGLTSK